MAQHLVNGKKSDQSTAPKPKKPNGNNKAAKRAAIVAGTVMLTAVVSVMGFVYAYPNVFPHVTIGSIEVGGLSRSEAEKQVAAKSAGLYENANIAVTIYDTTYDIAVSEVLEDVDVSRSVDNAFAVGRTGGVLTRIGAVLGALIGETEAQIAAQVDEAGLTERLERIAATALTEPVEPSWELEENRLIIHAGKPGVQFDIDVVRSTLAEKIRLMDFVPYEVDTELTETPQIDIDKIAEQVIGPAVNAIVSKEDGKTIVPEKNGVQFDIEEARSMIGDGSQARYEIPVQVIPAAITAEKLKQVLFRDTLASTSTSLNEGNAPRTNNVRLACNAINGQILNPGEEFSYNGTVGQRTAERGYKTAGAYVDGKVVEEFGGGVCQPSSTLYMAALRADMEVVSRTNHMFTVAYTPLGEDATVDWGNIDFRFKNNTDYPVKILMVQRDGRCIAQLIGTKTSDKNITTRTEVIQTYSPETIEKKDGTKEVGYSQVEEDGITGYSTRTYKVITENGKTTEVLANTSNYTKRDKTVIIGSKPKQTPKPEEPKKETVADSGQGETQTPTQEKPVSERKEGEQ